MLDLHSSIVLSDETPSNFIHGEKESQLKYQVECLMAQILTSNSVVGNARPSKSELEQQRETYKALLLEASEHGLISPVALLICPFDAKWEHHDIDLGYGGKNCGTLSLQCHLCSIGVRNHYQLAILEEEMLHEAIARASAGGHRLLAYTLATIHPSKKVDTWPENYMLVDDDDQFQAAMLMLHMEKKGVAVDLEGVNLCRSGRVSIIQACLASGFVIIFDMTVLGSRAFERDIWGKLNLGTFLEYNEKIMFDGRADADALYHLFGVRLGNVFCLQVASTLRYAHLRDPFLKGWEHYLEISGVLTAQEMQVARRIKCQGKEMFTNSCNAWEQRPLPETLLLYARYDVRFMSRLKVELLKSIHIPEGSFQVSEELVKEICRTRLDHAIHNHCAARGHEMAKLDIPHFHDICDSDSDEEGDVLPSVQSRFQHWPVSAKGRNMKNLGHQDMPLFQRFAGCTAYSFAAYEALNEVKQQYEAERLQKRLHKDLEDHGGGYSYGSVTDINSDYGDSD